MARIPTYQKDTHISDLDRIIGTDGDTNELATKNFFLGDIAEYVIDKFIDPDAVSFTIPVFRDTQDVLGSNATRITGSIISQDVNPGGAKITIAGDLTLERDQSDTTLTLISDGSNQGENNNPSIKFIQDGGAQNAAVGFNIIDDTGGGTIPGSGNRFWIVNAMNDDTGSGGITFGTAQVDGWENAIGRFMIRGDGKGLFGHPDSLYNKTLGSQFEIYDNRDENTTTDPSFSVYSVVDYAAPSGNEGAGGIKQILDVYNNGVFETQEAMMLIPGTTSSDLAASTPIGFYANSDMNTISPSNLAGTVTHDDTDAHWILNGTLTETTTHTLKVNGSAEITGNVILGSDSSDLITQNGTLYLNSPIKDTTDVLGDADQILVSDASGELTFTDLASVHVGGAEVIEVPVKNLQGSALTKGDPVYISGSVGASGRLEVQLADASDAAKMPALGLLKQDLGINEEGFAVVTGKLRNLSTSPIDGQTPLANDVIYVKANGTTGAALTLTKPTGSSLIQNMGKVGRVSTSNDGTFVVSSILRTNDIPNIPRGSMWVGDATGVANPLPIGTAGQVLVSDGTDVNWEAPEVQGSGTTNTVPLWSDGPNGVLADSILLQDTNPSNTGLVEPGNRVKTDGTLGVKDSLTVNYTDNTSPRVFPPYQPTGDFNTKPTGRIGVVNDVGALQWAFSAVSIGGLGSEYTNRSGLLHRSGGGYRLLLSNATERTILFDSDGNSFINSGNLAIGHDTPTEKLDVQGNVKASSVKTGEVKPIGLEVKINQANFFANGNISNDTNTDIGATLHLRTGAPLTDQDVIALTKGGQGTGFPSGIKQNAQGEYTLLLRDNSNSQSIKLVSNKATPSFIDNGKVFLGGNTDQQDGAVTINNRRWTNGVKNAFIQFNKSGTQLDTALEFKQGSILKGSISYDSTGTNYNVTSDYRVKENIVEITDGIERLKQLKPSKFNFITDAEKVVDGFIAHEVQEVIPEAVTGEKDATEEYEVTPAEYDDYGNLVSEAVMGTRDAYQQIDQAKIVPLLTAALQEAVSKIESLETRIQTLESN